MAMARKKPRLATVPEARYSVGEDAVDFMQISQEPPGSSPEMAGRRNGSTFSPENIFIYQRLVSRSFEEKILQKVFFSFMRAQHVLNYHLV